MWMGSSCTNTQQERVDEGRRRRVRSQQEVILHLGGFLQLFVVLDDGIQVHHLKQNPKQTGDELRLMSNADPVPVVLNSP